MILQWHWFVRFVLTARESQNAWLEDEDKEEEEEEEEGMHWHGASVMELSMDQ